MMMMSPETISESLDRESSSVETPTEMRGVGRHRERAGTKGGAAGGELDTARTRLRTGEQGGSGGDREGTTEQRELAKVSPRPRRKIMEGGSWRPLEKEEDRLVRGEVYLVSNNLNSVTRDVTRIQRRLGELDRHRGQS